MLAGGNGQERGDGPLQLTVTQDGITLREDAETCVQRERVDRLGPSPGRCGGTGHKQTRTKRKRNAKREAGSPP